MTRTLQEFEGASGPIFDADNRLTARNPVIRLMLHEAKNLIDARLRAQAWLREYDYYRYYENQTPTCVFMTPSWQVTLRRKTGLLDVEEVPRGD